MSHGTHLIRILRWNAAKSIAAYLDVNPELYRDKNVLELGAGGGLPGIVTAINGAANVRERLARHR